MAENRENQINNDVVDITEERAEKDQQVQVEEQTIENQSPMIAMNEELEPLFEDDEMEKFRTHWMNIQSKFVDNPQESVREADELVANVLKSVTMGFHGRRTSLEKQWKNGNNISTEDLRMALKRYRSFFDRLLTLES